MITNLIVLDPNWLYSDGDIRKDAVVYPDRVICHPSSYRKMQDALMESFESDKPPIFVSLGEWETMKIFSKNIRESTTPSEKILYNTQYQRWWNKIRERAKEQADGWRKEKADNYSIEKSQSKKVTKFRRRKTK